MTLRIHRSFIATIAALAVAITGFSAAPARAGDDDLAKALAVILGLAVVGTAIKNRNDDHKSRPQVYTHQPRAHPRVVQPRAHPRVVQPNRGHVQPRPLPRNVNRKLLPQQCLYNLRTVRGQTIQAFGQRCLNQNYKFTNSLPRQCGRNVQTRHGTGYAYGARCLTQQGYQLARR